VSGGVCWERRCHSDLMLCFGGGGGSLEEREMEDVMCLRWTLLHWKRMRSLHLCDLIKVGRYW